MQSRTFNVMTNIGKARYVVNFWDGQKAHRDGSPFVDIRICNNKKGLATCVADLKSQGYAEA